MSHGFVYLARNESMPGLYKIGSTASSPTARMRQLSQPTGVPSPFILMGYCEINGHTEFERTLHSDFSHARSSTNREFFRLSPAAIKEIGWLFSVTGDSYWLDVDQFSSQLEFLIKYEMEILS